VTRSEIKSCEDAIRLLAAYLDREVSEAAHAEVERHLSTCRSCYSRAQFERRLKKRLAELGQEPVRPALSQRVQELIKDFTVTGSE
jgi:anti-sigma factor (TIGR02949 family)